LTKPTIAEPSILKTIVAFWLSQNKGTIIRHSKKQSPSGFSASIINTLVSLVTHCDVGGRSILGLGAREEVGVRGEAGNAGALVGGGFAVAAGTDSSLKATGGIHRLARATELTSRPLKNRRQ
jgi:hypothetical protein